MNKMNTERAKNVLQMIDRISQEIDLLGKLILQRKLKPVPVPAKRKNGYGI
jgi:hypothetical protein